MAANAIDQTRRMLSLVTYLRERPGAHVADVARAFGITEDELISDLDVLPMCGTSFRGGDLLDIDTDGDRIWWHNPDDVAAPLRLAADEATALLVAARAVATLPGLRESDREALLRATAKLEAAAGEAAGASSRLSVTFESEGGVFAEVDRAISEQPAPVGPLLLARPRRAHRARGRPDPALRRRPHLYGGVVCGSPRRAAPSGSTAWPRSASSTSTRRRRSWSCATSPRVWSSPPPTTPRSWSRSAPADVGSPSTTRTTGPRSCRTADCGSPCAHRTPPRCSRLALRLGSDGRIVAPQELADNARTAAAAALAAYDG